MTYKKLIPIFLSFALVACNCSSFDKEEKATQTRVKATQVNSNVETREYQNIYFETDQSKLSQKAKKVLDKEVYEWLSAGEPTIKVVVNGHADERGSTEYNNALGKKRAEAVKAYLVKKGIDANRITTKSYGESKPVDDGHDEEAWQKNRRSVTITKIKS